MPEAVVGRRWQQQWWLEGGEVGEAPSAAKGEVGSRV